MSSASNTRSYVVPRYRAAGDVAFHHVLHGTVPGHQIDYLYCPEVPQGALKQTHFGHLSRLIKYIEPRAGADHAFALGNLSRDDVQHEPGHGGVALLFALRVPGVTDHAGRDMPPYAHGLLAIDRALDRATLFEAATAFYRRFLERRGARDRRGDFYREYVRTVEERPGEVQSFLERSMAAIDDLPHPGQSPLSWDFEADEAAPARRIVIVHADGEPFETIARHAAALGAMLYRSNIKWTSISTGRALDIAGGTTVRFVPASEAISEEGTLLVPIDDVPDDEDALAERLFGARRRTTEPTNRRIPGTAATLPMAPLESELTEPETVVGPPVIRPPGKPAAISRRASPPGAMNALDAAIQARPRRRLFVALVTVVTGLVGALSAATWTRAPSPQPATDMGPGAAAPGPHITAKVPAVAPDAAGPCPVPGTPTTAEAASIGIETPPPFGSAARGASRRTPGPSRSTGAQPSGGSTPSRRPPGRGIAGGDRRW